MKSAKIWAIVLALMLLPFATVTAFALEKPGMMGVLSVIDSEAGLREAIDDALPGDTVTLQGDIIMADTLTINKSLTLDLNGHTISGSDPGSVNTVIIVSGGATLTIADTAGGGKIITTDAGTQPCVIRVTSGSLILNGGTISTEGTDKPAQAVYLGADATFTMNGGSVQTTAAPSGFSTAVNVKDDGATFNLVNGTIDCAKGNAIALSSGTTLSMTGGSVSGGGVRAAVSGAMGSAQLNISGGTITAAGTGPAIGPGQNNTAAIGGTAVVNGDVKVPGGGTLNITGGTFNGAVQAAAWSNLNISGGTFNDQVEGDSERTAITGGAFAQDPAQYASGDDILVAGFTRGGATQFIVGDEETILQRAGQAQSGDTIEITKGSIDLGTDLDGVTVKNSGDGTVVVNNQTVGQGEEVAAHTCVPADTWDHDETQHWRNCAVGGERLPETVAAHAFGDWITVKEPTLTETGSKEKTCGVCGYKQTAEIDKLVAATYPVTSGANGTWTQGSGQGLSFTVGGAFDKFTGVQVDGSPLEAPDYTAAEGSTVVTLKADYLETLAAGEHTVTILFTDGEASVSFAVEQAPPEEEEEDDDQEAEVPATRDHTWRWI
ncbi:MAG: hypothetical protein ACOX88_07355 [Christensenellales bacterium]|jgi:hypothetical protein